VQASVTESRSLPPEWERPVPFSKYTVDPAHIEAMRMAFRKVCEALELDCRPEDRVTELIAMRIVEFAKTGVNDADELCSLVLQDFKAERLSAAQTK
jgi:hypothetical protein